ncbi:AEC family transporter [Candidatus Tisiphia endosymbiont of Nemotelus uliginosus]|uniref:AEC family transporter n=1 Tax=Candidatus Tisiphia endosymbiont of Nemotelus uliginosus TaxID=3077926 RepID=UPI0035C92970
MNEIFSSTLPIFLITLLGSIIKRKWLTSEEFWRGLEKLSYFFLFPIMLFNYISVADLSAAAIIRLVFALIISTGIVSLGLIIYQKKTNFDKIQFTSIFQGAVRYNSYIFFAISSPLLGANGLAIVSVISSYMIIFTNIISVMIFARYIPDSSISQSPRASFILMLKLILQNPLIIASIVGFLFNYSNLELYLGIKKTLSTLSDSALAIGMLNVGAGLKFAMRGALLHNVLFTSFVKLVVFPIVTVIVLSLMSITGPARSIGVLYSCLPCASTAYVLSRQLGGDPESMASIITFTTLFSVISLSVLMYLWG